LDPITANDVRHKASFKKVRGQYLIKPEAGNVDKKWKRKRGTTGGEGKTKTSSAERDLWPKKNPTKKTGKSARRRAHLA